MANQEPMEGYTHKAPPGLVSFPEFVPGRKFGDSFGGGAQREQHDISGTLDASLNLGTSSHYPITVGRDLQSQSQSYGQGQSQVQQPFDPRAHQIPTHQPPRDGAGRGRRGGGRGRGRERWGGRGTNAPPIFGSSRPSAASYATTYGRMKLVGQFIPEDLKYEMQQRSLYEAAAVQDERALQQAGLTSIIQQFHSLYPLEDPATAHQHGSAAFGGIRSFIFKGIHAGDGAAYAVRRFDGHQLPPTAALLEAAQMEVSRWSVVADHPNVVGIREVFATDEVAGTPCLYYVYDYYPGAVTLEQAHLLPLKTDHGNVVRNTTLLTENMLWSYLVQLIAAIRAIHTSGLTASRTTLTASKIIVVAPNRLRLASIGISGALEYAKSGEGNQVLQEQQDDLAAIGSLVLELACTVRHIPMDLDALATCYSRDFCGVLARLLASSRYSKVGFQDWKAAASALGERVFMELEDSHKACDTLTTALAKEYENGRLLRLLVKLNMVLERSYVLGDPKWSETGNRYLLSLFRDFVFHQVDERGSPNLDWGPIIEALNKLDAGVEERIMLLSKDEASMLVVSYADVQRCLLASYNELKSMAGM